MAYCLVGLQADGNLMGKSEMVQMGLPLSDGPTEVRYEERWNPQQQDAAAAGGEGGETENKVWSGLIDIVEEAEQE